MTKIEQVRTEMMNALKAGDKEKKNALSLLLSALKNKQIDKMSDLTEEEENQVVYKEIKEAQETIDTTPADRTDIIDECRKRIEVYSEFAPKLMGEDEIRPIIESVLSELGIDKPVPQDKGKIMKALMPKVKGKADGKIVNQLVSSLFA
ncbi:MAG: GatB/YqeY domain-containing protein [Clostridia bacterium]|nr:GatB/YqeY domain-containing protein [Clostridia bacterium]MBR3295808.1 GatB/YqeY domain-containing protein [Clostridia bacterium]